MARKKLSDEEKKPKIGVSIDKELLEIMEEYLEKNNISNRSKYIEKLIRDDFAKKGKIIERKF